MVRPDGSVCDAGEIIESEPPRRLVIRWQHQDNPELKAEGDIQKIGKVNGKIRFPAETVFVEREICLRSALNGTG